MTEQEYLSELRPWRRCHHCQIGKWRREFVPGKMVGSSPATLFFIGEGPGKSENFLGEPFIGVAGRILRKGVEKACELSGRGVPSYWKTNTVACRPCDGPREPNRQPTQAEMFSCLQRLQLEYAYILPQKVVLLGEVPKAACRRLYPGAATLRHPAYVGYSGGIGSTEWMAFVRGLIDILDRLEEEQRDEQDQHGVERARGKGGRAEARAVRSSDQWHHRVASAKVAPVQVLRKPVPKRVVSA